MALTPAEKRKLQLDVYASLITFGLVVVLVSVLRPKVRR